MGGELYESLATNFVNRQSRFGEDSFLFGPGAYELANLGAGNGGVGGAEHPNEISQFLDSEKDLNPKLSYT
jgi:hypothetical protein